MNLFVQNSRCPSQVLFAFDEVAKPSVQQVRWAVAYSTRSGCVRLVERISNRIGRAQWDRIQKQFITSLDFGLTDPGALEFLSGLPGSTVYIANPEVATRPRFQPSKAYHPKIYLFDEAAHSGYVVGSANLTNSALISNTEVVAVGEETPQNSTWNDLWAELRIDTMPLTDTILGDYRRSWRRPSRRLVAPDPSPAAPTIRPGEKSVFWDVIAAGTLAPMTFNHFWVEAGSMSSGGSHNQLELPRGANRFFGFNHSVYGAAHVTIGLPRLTLRRNTWTDRPLTWHGNNKMERLNLPTTTQGGFDYRNTAVLFRRHAGGFEINVAPWDDDTAIAWRAASQALNTVYRLGGRGSRICGLF